MTTPLDVLKDLVQNARVAIPGTAYYDALKRARAFLATEPPQLFVQCPHCDGSGWCAACGCKRFIKV